MKAILLCSAAILNGGAYIDAGETVPVGTGKNEITAERAAEIVKAKRAEEVDGGDGLDGKTVAELKAIANDDEVDLGAAKTKAEILAAIRAHRDDAGGEG